MTAAGAGKDTVYGGTRVRLIGRIGTTRCSLQVDVGFGDAVTPAPPSQASSTPASSSAGVKHAALPLAGRTVLVKDNIETREWPTTAGSLALKDNLTGRDAPMAARLREAGAVGPGSRGRGSAAMRRT